MAGYHTRHIVKGKLGEVSKIREELEELEDADYQGAKILILCEIADLVGAVERYLEEKFPGITIKDARQMAKLTRSHKEQKKVKLK